MSKLIAWFQAILAYVRSPAFKSKKQAVIALIARLQRLLDHTRKLDFLAPLLIRCYLAPVFWMAGSNKFAHFQETALWFGNADHGLGVPAPYLMVILAASTEILGALFLLLGFAVRWSSIPLMVTMAVAATAVHWKNGWLAIATGSGLFATERTVGAIERLDKAKALLQQYGNYDWLTANGNFVVLNNGIEFAATYLLMLLVLIFVGGGRYVSVDYWIRKRFQPH